MSKRRKISRRRFLGEASCAALGTTTLMSTALQLGTLNVAAARPHILESANDYKAIVCILLAGGADSHNMLVPVDNQQYDNYVGLRGRLAIAPELLHQISSQLGNIPNAGKTFGIHPAMPNLKTLYDQGDLAYLSNIGTLIEPVFSRSEYENDLKRLPLGLYSHADQIMQWQTSVPQDRSAVGVGGRMADILSDMNSIDKISMNISLSGKNRFQAGNSVLEYAISNDPNVDNMGIQSFPTYWSNSGFLTQIRDDAMRSIVEEQYQNVFQKTYADLTKQTLESVEFFKSKMQRQPGYPTVFGPSIIEQDLRMMADIISINTELGAKRQVFFTTFGGWDHHDEVLNNQLAMLPRLDNGIYSFINAMNDLGLKDNVTLMTISDFGRTLTSNGNGTDHAWGGNSIVVGGSVNGGNVYGDYPDLVLNNPLNLDARGRFIPTTSSDELYAELALWFGVSINDLSYILPNIGNFHNYQNDPSPIGLFN